MIYMKQILKQIRFARPLQKLYFSIMRKWMGFALVLGMSLASRMAVADELIPTPWRDLLRELLEINSGSENTDGLELVRKRLIPEFEKLGFRTTTVDTGDRHKILVFDFDGEKPELLLLGHVDTVFPAASAFQKFSSQGDRLMGPGVIDMKGGIVLILNILTDLKQSPKDAEILKKIRVLLDDDEETGASHSKAKFAEWVKGIPYGLVFEPGLSNRSLVNSHSGVHWSELTVKGRAAHAGMEHEKGLNACVELAHKIIEISKLTDYRKKLTVNVGTIHGGIKPNVVCEEASAKIDIRFVERADLNSALKRIENITAKSATRNSLLGIETHSQLKDLGETPSLTRASTDKLYLLAQEAGLQAGVPVKGEHVGYGTDAGHLAGTGIQLLVGLGPVGGGMHTDSEFMDLNSYLPRKKLGTALIRRVLNSQGSRERKPLSRPEGASR